MDFHGIAIAVAWHKHVYCLTDMLAQMVTAFNGALKQLPTSLVSHPGFR